MMTREKIIKTMDTITKLLLKKNKSYGDSATNPRNIFAKGDAIENICARIDDKIARIENVGLTPEVYDTVDDLMGYLCLLKIAIRDKAEKEIIECDDGAKKSKTRVGALSRTGN